MVCLSHFSNSLCIFQMDKEQENSIVWSFAAPGLSRPGLAVSEKEARSRVVEKKPPSIVKWTLTIEIGTWRWETLFVSDHFG